MKRGRSSRSLSSNSFSFNNRKARIALQALAAAAAVTGFQLTAQADVSLWWDINGATTGGAAGTTANGR